MADRDRIRDKDQNASGDRLPEDESREKAEKRGNDDNEWMRDQVGENTNLSGSTTFRTLPDQPEETDEDDSDRDTKDRQSNR